MSEEIRLTIPAEEDFQGIAHLVVGGLAVRHDATFESLEDLHLALENLLDRCPREGELTLVVRVGDHELETSVGPYGRGVLQAELDRTSDGVGLRRVLDTVTDGYAIAERDGQEWAQVRKALRRVEGGGGG